MKAGSKIIQSLTFACLMLLVTTGTVTSAECDTAASGIVRAKVIATEAAHLDMFEGAHLVAAGGGKLEDHFIGRITTPMPVSERQYEFLLSAPNSMKPFDVAWSVTNQQLPQKNLILQYEQVIAGPGCAPCASGCNCSNCQNTYICGGGSKCMKKLPNGYPDCQNKCCP